MIKYHLAEDTIDRGDIDRLIAWLKGYPRLTKGKVTLELEEKWSRWAGRKYSVFCNSGSSANLLMFYALLISGRLKNKKVVVPSVGWVTSIAPAIQFGFEPLICEADPDTFGLDLNYLESLLKKHKPGAVMLVQVLGVPHKMKEIQGLKEKYGFFLLEDACAAVGSVGYGKKLGGFGDLAAYSLYFGHQISTIEGGMVSTDDKHFLDLLMMLRSHGWSKDLDPAAHKALVKRYEVDDFHSPFVFYEPGFNLRSTDLNAYIGLGQVDKLDEFAARRHTNHLRYKKILGDKFYPPAQKTPALAGDECAKSSASASRPWRASPPAGCRPGMVAQDARLCEAEASLRRSRGPRRSPSAGGRIRPTLFGGKGEGGFQGTAGLPAGLHTQNWEDPEARISSISFGLVTGSKEERRAIVSALVQNGIETRIFSAGNLGLHPFWFNRFGKASFPVADRVHYCGLFLPNHPRLKAEDVDFISEVVLKAVRPESSKQKVAAGTNL